MASRSKQIQMVNHVVGDWCISSLFHGCAAARILEFKKEFSSSKSSNNTLCGSPAVSGMEVDVSGGGASARKASDILPRTICVNPPSNQGFTPFAI